MGYEVDFLHVGEGEKSGDAICLRFGDLWGARESQFVMVIDGGTMDSGERLVRHIKKHYGTETVDLVVSTHPDNDHISGLRVVLNEMTVGRLWMHLPWQHASDFRALFRDRTITSLGLKRQIRASLDTATEIEELGRRKEVPIDEPFADIDLPFNEIGIDVLGPSSSYYANLLPQFRETPEPRALAAESTILGRAATTVFEAAKTVVESWHIETLSDPDEDATSAENNSSAILTIHRDSHTLLFTGDAGTPALDRAADAAETRDIHLPALNFVHVPHHGSRRNVGPTVLDRILGPKYQTPSNSKTAFVSASQEAPKHPARKVCNAFQRRGAKDRVYTTEGRNMRHHHDAPPRSDYSKADSVPFFERVEE